MSKQIVVALDGSSGSHGALRTAAELANAMGRDLVLLHVHPENPAVSATMSGLAEVSQESLRESGRESAREIFDEAEQRLGSQSVAERQLLMGDPAEELIGYMEQHPDAHLVMGRRGLSRIKRLVMGSVSDKVVRHSPGLVTVVS